MLTYIHVCIHLCNCIQVLNCIPLSLAWWREGANYMCIVEKETDGFWLQMNRKQSFSYGGKKYSLLSRGITVLFSSLIWFPESTKKWGEHDQGSVFLKMLLLRSLLLLLLILKIALNRAENVRKGFNQSWMVDFWLWWRRGKVTFLISGKGKLGESKHFFALGLSAGFTQRTRGKTNGRLWREITTYLHTKC